MNKYREKLHSLYKIHDRKVDFGLLVISLIVIIVSLFYPCQSMDIIALVLGLVGILYWSSAFRYFSNQIKLDILLVHGSFLLKSVIISVLTPFTLYLVCFSLSFLPCMDLTNTTIASEAFEGDGYHLIHQSASGRPNLWTIYFHYIDPGNQHMTLNHASRGLVGICTMLGVFLLNGLLVSSLIGWVDKRKDAWASGTIRYGFNCFRNRNFAVVIGANEIVSSVIRNLLAGNAPDEINNKNEKNNYYVILQTSRNVAEVRQELGTHLSDEEMNRLIIYHAQRDSVQELNRLFLDKATEIYVLGESTESDRAETYHDALNMRCVNLMADILVDARNKSEEEYKRKVCKVMFDYQSTYSIFQFSDISNQINSTLVFIPFNRYESWARKVIVEGYAMNDCHAENGKEISYTPLDGKGISPDSDAHVHLVVVGMSKMGVALGVQALLQCHYLNYANAELLENQDLKNKRRTRITFIDTNADKEMAFFKGRYDNLFSLMRHRYMDASVSCNNLNWTDPFDAPDSRWRHLSKDGSNFIDAEVEFIKGEIESDGIRNYLTAIAEEGGKATKLTIAICVNRTHQAISAALYMPIEVYKSAQEIWVYQNEASDIVDNLTGTEQKDLRYKKLRPFGMLYGDYMSDRTLYLKALLVNAAYDVNNKNCINFVDKDTYKDLRPTWKELSIDKKLSNKFFADSVYQKIRSVFSEEDQTYTFKYITGLLKTCKASELDAIMSRLKANEEILAICEHNRWNMQQLLLGYSPCDEKLDREFEELNKNAEKDHSAGYRQWKTTHDFNSLKPIEQYLLKRDDADFRELPIGRFARLKTDCKEGEYRIHPNICEYAHLPDVDYGAQNYDKDLNDIGIRYILTYVDGHKNRNLTCPKSDDR